MPFSLSDRLQTERDRYFTGRIQEYDLFQSAIAAMSRCADPTLPFHLLYVFGPGGIGKTTLLRQFIRQCAAANIRTLYLDARHIEPSAQAFLETLQEQLASPNPSFMRQLSSTVLFIDTYETLTPIDDWFRETFLPQLPGNTLIVLASRFPLSAAWQTDSGWRSLIQTLSLRNLSPTESQSYLNARNIPSAHYPKILDFTHGHPLALSLIADGFMQTQTFDFQPDAAIDQVQLLLKRFIERVPTATHRMALEACASVRVLTESLLREMLDLPDAHDLFEWLCHLSLIESNALGLFPHDVAREVLMADLRWRNFDWYAELHRRARNYYRMRLGQIQGQLQRHNLLFDYFFLHRDNQCVRAVVSWNESSRLVTDTYRETDQEILREMVEKHEGKESAQIFLYWLNRQPKNTIVIRDPQGQVTGFMTFVLLHQATQADLMYDPAAIASWNYLQQCAVLREAEGATLFRFWMAKDTYQKVSPTQSLILINRFHYYLNTSGLAFTFLPCADPEFWHSFLSYANFTRLSSADFEVGGHQYGMYGHDWRVTTPVAWQALMAQREIAAIREEVTTPAAKLIDPPEPLLVLSKSEFIEAVQMAFRQLATPAELSKNPLVRSRFVLDAIAQSEGETAPSALQRFIRETTESLESSPREHKLYRVLYRTYLQPALTQEKAAEALDLPFSTYRRHLKSGVQQVAELLWQREIK
jgi:hypothetical protein